MTSTKPTCGVFLIIGTGGMGLSIARKMDLSAGNQIILADFSPDVLNTTLDTLRNDGIDAESYNLDISDCKAVAELARFVASKGHIIAIFHTAGLAAGGATAKRIYEVDTLGTANIIEAFLPVVSEGSSLTCIASMAGHMITLSPELESHLATSPSSQILQHPEIDLDAESPELAYTKSKRANILRVQAAAKAWGLKGARLNSISPGVIATPLILSQMETSRGASPKAMIEASALGRMGSPEEIANTAVFLAGPGASYITGNDILVDGGTVSARRWKV